MSRQYTVNSLHLAAETILLSAVDCQLSTVNGVRNA